METLQTFAPVLIVMSIIFLAVTNFVLIQWLNQINQILKKHGDIQSNLYQIFHDLCNSIEEKTNA